MLSITKLQTKETIKNKNMRQLKVLNWVTVDGFIAGANGETDWFVWDSEIETFYQEQQNKIDCIIYGRETYETMSQYWPNSEAKSELPSIVDHMNNTQKIVFSKSLDKANWNNTKIERDITKEQILSIKQESGKDIVIYGSGTIITQLSELELIDEYLLMINPVILGAGKPLFPNQTDRLKLNLTETQKFSCGSVLNTYKP